MWNKFLFIKYSWTYPELSYVWQDYEEYLNLKLKNDCLSMTFHSLRLNYQHNYLQEFELSSGKIPQLQNGLFQIDVYRNLKSHCIILLSLSFENWCIGYIVFKVI